MKQLPKPKYRSSESEYDQILQRSQLKQVLTCPRCGTENRGDRQDCRYCQCPLYNTCSDPRCRYWNLPFAKYCKKCGKETSYMLYGVFDPATRESMHEEAAYTLARYEDMGIYYEWEDGPER